ncbi:gliding motility-associated ABC transporter substrate-binding protein GldG [Flavobacterium qiangtangense]|uniref:Gliding motility-associated ABC transporter substrate-binding protein GldG n=1 Tax=Flavobacterium qiangtangense TaxID=1442595 RepID=A0ABW1PJV2_9FLAO
MKANQKLNLQKLGLVVIAIIALNIASNFFFKRFDLTKDKRYTLSESTLKLIKKVDKPLYVTVYLDGDFPAQFKRLQTETRQMLEEFRAYNSNIIFIFDNPSKDETGELAQKLMQFGFVPTNIQNTEKGKKSMTPVYPWAMAEYGEKWSRVPLLVNNFGNNAEENISKSVQLLEFALADAITKLTNTNMKKIAVLKGNGEMNDKYLSDFILNLREYYLIGEFNLDSLSGDQNKTIQNLERFDATIIAKPTQTFSDSEKYILDQYVMNGGKTLWLMDKVVADIDSLQNKSQTSLAYPRDLNLDDMFFKYGVRINSNLVQDLLSTPITARGETGEFPIDWLYSPMIKSQENHPINKNVNLVKLEFANQIDTLKNNIKKTVLLQSSAQSKVVGAPIEFGLNQFMDDLNEAEYNKGNQTVGVLLEGKFTSAFKNRVKPFTATKGLDDGKENKMIVIADGDIINYTYVNKKPMQNGLDQWTQQVYGNKDFLMNSVNYLLDDTGLINIRSKDVKLALLDENKVAENYTFTQFLTVGLPIVILGIFGFLFTYLRKRKYSK